jgi:hypothetical protein
MERLGDPTRRTQGIDDDHVFPDDFLPRKKEVRLLGGPGASAYRAVAYSPLATPRGIGRGC